MRTWCVALAIFSSKIFAANSFPKYSQLLDQAERASGMGYWHLRQPEQDNVRLRVEQTFTSLMSWMELVDASAKNPFQSARLKKLYSESPQCVHRVYLSLVEEQLRSLSSEEQSAVFLAELHRELEGGPSLLKPVVLAGTQSYDTSVEALSRSLITHVTPIFDNEWNWLKTNLDLSRGTESLRRNLEVVESCQENSLEILDQIFPWLDFSALREVAHSTEAATHFQENLRAFLVSTEVPRVPPHAQSAFALHPVLGVALLRDFPGELRPNLLRLVLEAGYEKGQYVTEKSCRALQTPAVVASILGFRLSDSAEDAALWTEWMKLRLTVFAAHTAGLSECGAVLPFIENLSPTAVGFPNLDDLVQFGSNYEANDFVIGDFQSSHRLKLKVSRKAIQFEGRAAIKKARLFL